MKTLTRILRPLLTRPLLTRPSRLSLALLLAAVALPAFATTYVAMDDGDLADGARIIVQARVLHREAIPAPAPATTDYLVLIERVIKGFVPGNSLIVRVPGAVRPGGLSLVIWGAPEFGEGDSALLFLNPGKDGVFQITQLMLGAFHRLEVGGQAYAVRDLSEVSEVPHPLTGKLSGGDRPRDFDAFVAWLEAREEGREPVADYFVTRPPEGLGERLRERFTLIANPPIRWFEFDTGGSVAWFAHQGGQPGLADGGFDEFRRALNAWNADSVTPIQQVYAGTTSASAGFTDPAGDGRNTILFGDPNNEINGVFSCNRGGTIAIGGPRFDTGLLRPFNGRQFYVTLEAEVIVNDGTQCYGSQPDGNLTYEEVYGHELGHTLGLGHSCGFAANIPNCFGNPTLDDALMRATVHADGRGARLGSDDLSAARSLYRLQGGGGGGGGRPAAPSELTVELDGLDALVNWQDDAGNEDGFRIYRRQGAGALTQIAELGADATGFTDADLSPSTSYTYQIAAFNASGESRGILVTVVTPDLVPVVITSFNRVADARPGEVVPFEVEFTGPAVTAEWFFDGDAMGRSGEPCFTDRFCAVHFFSAPGSYRVTVELVGDLGQRVTASGTLNVVGDALTFTRHEGIIQSVIFGPRGETGTFESNCWTHNASTETLLVEYTYLPRGAGNPDPERREIVLAPGTSVFLPNIVSTLFGETNSQGSIAVAYMAPSTAADPDAGQDAATICRSFVVLPGSRTSFGQFVGENRAETWTATPKVVTGIFQDDSFQSTVLGVNVDNTSGAVNVSLIDADGASVGPVVTLPLGPRTMRSRPISQIFPEVGNHPGPFTARFEGSGIRFLASATLLETGSEDQVFINAREPDSTNPLFIPRVARAASQFGAFLTSQLVARNDSQAATELTIELWRRGQSNLTPDTVMRTVPARGILVVDDVITDLFGLESAVGALRITWANSEGIAPRIQTYSFNLGQSAASPTFGMLVDSQSAASASSEMAIDFGAEQSDLFRADFGILSLGDTITPMRITLRREGGSPVATIELTLQPRQHLERNLAGIFTGIPIGEGSNWTVETEVLAGGPILTYLANINASGDIFFVPGNTRTAP